MELSDIISAILAGRVKPSVHARQELEDDGLTISEAYRAAVFGEIIEDYPNDFPHPSCLVLGYVGDGDPVHSVWAYDKQARRAILVTAYRPDPEIWGEWRYRRSESDE